MPSTYSTSLRLELQADGENSTTWGQKANTVFQLLEQAVAGYVSISVAGAVDVTLTASNGISDQSRNKIIFLTGVLTGNINVIVPTAINSWVFYNNTTGSFTLTVKTAAGTGIILPQTTRIGLYCDGTNVNRTEAFGAPYWCGSAGGTANALTLTMPASALATGLALRFLAIASNTAASTLNPNSLGATTLKRLDGTGLQANDIPSGAVIEAVYDGSAFRLISMTPASVVGFKNAIINGDFKAVQRGSAFVSPASGSYTLDRWIVAYDGSGAFTLAQGTFGASGSTISNYINWNQSGAIAGCTFRQLAQRVEDVHTFSSQNVTISFSSSCTSGTVSVTPVISQIFGFGGSPSATVVTNGTAQTVSTTGARFSCTITVPSISAKTLGTSGDYLQVTLTLPTSGTYNVSFWDVQAEVGSIATPFERRPVGLETFLCQRYYQILQPLSYGYGVAGTQVVAAATFAAALRTNPTIASTSTSDSNVTGAALSTANNQAIVVGTITVTGGYIINHAITVSAEL